MRIACGGSRVWVSLALGVLLQFPSPLAGQDPSLSTEERQQLIENAIKLDNQFQQFYRRGAYRDALAAERKALEILSRATGQDHAFTAISYNNLGNAARALGDYSAARTYHERALAIRRKVLGEENADTARSYGNLGNVGISLGDYPAARKYLERALAIQRKLLGEEHVDTAMLYNNLGVVCVKLGDYADARAYHERALVIRRKLLGAENAATAMSYTNLGNLADDVGDYAGARRYHEQALAIRRKVLGEDHPNTADSYNNLGVVAINLGDYAAARKYHERALAIRRKVFGDEHPDTALSYDNLGGLAALSGDYAAARTYYEQALAINRKILGEEHVGTATSYGNLANVLRQLRDYADARKFHERALAIHRKALGAERAETASSYYNLGNVARDVGDYGAARSNYEQALAIYRKVLGEEHPDTALSYDGLVVVETIAGDWSAAARWMDQQRRGVRRHVTKILPSLSEREQQQFLKFSDQRYFQQSLSLAFLQPQNKAIRNQSAGWLLNAKGVGQQALAGRALLAREARDPSLTPVVRELKTIRETLARLSLAAPEKGRSDERQQKLAEWSARESDLARHLVQAGGAAQLGESWIELAAVRGALPADSILIDIARFQIAPFGEKDLKKWKWGPARYVAWIIPPAGHGEVQLVDVGEADRIDTQIKDLRRAIQAAGSKGSSLAKEGEPKAEAELRDLFQQLADRIWKPLAPHMADARQLFLSPDGALWLLPWGAIPVEKDKFLIERLTLNYLISGRDVVGSSATTVSNVRKPVLFADPNFDLAPEEVTTAAKAVLRSAYQDEAEGQRTNERSLLPKVGRLPGTAQEAAAIKPNVEKLAGQPPIVYQDVYALESVAKALSRPKVAIFSTHGFFLPDQVLKSDDKDQSLALAGEEHRGVTLTTAGRPFENPLLRCGLLFAGCNPRNEGQPGSGDDGVLTGMEIVGIDFRGTDLVVLSACETGIGTVNNGEGVAGLRQAFQLAGAEAVVATLWQIPDADSARLMNDFFANLAAGQAKGEALRNAQLKRIASRRERFGAAHPYFWAAFTLTGR